MAITTKIISTTTPVGKGFITYADQQDRGLSFEILVDKDGVTYVKVSGENETEINTWTERVAGTEVTEADVQTVINSLPPTPEQIKDQRITDLELALADQVTENESMKSRVTDTELALADLLAAQPVV